LCRAIADALDARFNPIAVGGEITGFSRAASGHCYFSLKDESGQMRCAMFRRAAGLLDFVPRDGDRVEVRGRLGVYKQRGELQLIVESMRAAGQGTLFEQFVKLKAKLEAQGLFDASRKRAIPSVPRGIGLVTSLGAAALHDVVTALRRRVPHIPVVLAPASVQGPTAPAELIDALGALYAMAATDPSGTGRHIDVILLVRGGGAMEDLWAFNDELLALTIARSPVPVICGVGHETDFTIADFVADLRAPTPTAAAEMVCVSRQGLLDVVESLQLRIQSEMGRYLDRQAQRLDLASARVGRPSSMAHRERPLLAALGQRLNHGIQLALAHRRSEIDRWQTQLPRAAAQSARTQQERLGRAQLRLGLLDPTLVLKRGYAWLTHEDGRGLDRVDRVKVGSLVRATLVDGVVDLSVTAVHTN